VGERRLGDVESLRGLGRREAVLALRPEGELDGGDFGEALDLAPLALKLEATRLLRTAEAAPKLPFA